MPDAAYSDLTTRSQVRHMRDVARRALGDYSVEPARLRLRYVANSAVKLRAYLDSGVYRHAVAGVVPIGA